MLKYLFRKSTLCADNDKPPLLILLHGVGSNEADLFSFASLLDERFFVVSVRAPFALGYGGFGWFELEFSPQGLSANLVQAEESRQKLLEFIDEITAKYDLDAQRVFLTGFSQGAIMSYALMLTEPEKFAGVVAMSGRLVSKTLPHQADPERLRDFPILVTHGTLDQVLPIENGRAAKTFLERLPVKLEYREYEMAHQVSEESLQDVADWLKEKIEILKG
ncbi:MAG: alpha/beta hydrolase [Pyrinomonadaceae bacterium]